MKNAIILFAGIIIGTLGIASAAIMGPGLLKTVDYVEWGKPMSKQTVVKIVDDENGATCYVYEWNGISCIGTSTVAR